MIWQPMAISTSPLTTGVRQPPRVEHGEKAFTEKFILAEDVNLDEIAQKFELAGGAIINVLRYVSLIAIKRGDNKVTNKDIISSIRREFGKEGKILQ